MLDDKNFFNSKKSLIGFSILDFFISIFGDKIFLPFSLNFISTVAPLLMVQYTKAFNFCNFYYSVIC